MAMRLLSLGRKETRLFSGFHSSHCRLNSSSPQSLVLFIPTRVPYTKFLSRQPSTYPLNIISTLALCCWPLHGGFRPSSNYLW